MTYAIIIAALLLAAALAGLSAADHQTERAKGEAYGGAVAFMLAALIVGVVLAIRELAESLGVIG